ncbi:MAG: hypothetical protein HY327_12785 [Chloroflexi bacterium]|nr:hypothetical protein [Chloroflexota bacterium]
MAEPPYGIIWNHLKKGESIPFLGAGASISSRPANAEWDERRSTFLPKDISPITSLDMYI